MIWVAVGAIVLLALVLVLRRLARDAEPVKVEHEGKLYTLAPNMEGDFYDTPELTKDGLFIKPFVPSTWQEMERYRQKRREQERERKKRQKQRRKLKGGRS